MGPLILNFSFMVGGDGKIYEGRGWHKIGSHTRGYNSKSIAIAFLGNFTSKRSSFVLLQFSIIVLYRRTANRRSARRCPRFTGVRRGIRRVG